MQMQNEHGGESQQPEPGSPWSATGSEQDGSDTAAASPAGSSAPPGHGGWDDVGQDAPDARAQGNWSVPIPFTPGAGGQAGAYGFGSPSGPARPAGGPPAGDYGYGQP